jgi:hypothetical protein
MNPTPISQIVTVQQYDKDVPKHTNTDCLTVRMSLRILSRTRSNVSLVSDDDDDDDDDDGRPVYGLPSMEILPFLHRSNQ